MDHENRSVRSPFNDEKEVASRDELLLSPTSGSPEKKELLSEEVGERVELTTPSANIVKMVASENKMALSEDPTKVKFTNSYNTAAVPMIMDGGGSQNGDAKVDIENVQMAFAGMGKEELMKYADDPFWVRLRWTFFALFWVVWLSMLIGAIVIVVMTPGCPPLPTRQWWQKGVIYQVYPRSFKDADQDGRGDIKGIESKLDYVNEIGVNTIWLSPIYKSPMADFGYDISDFKDVDPTFGTMDDFKSLLNATKAKGLKLVLDFVPNHSSNQHPWFVQSRQREANYSSYYIWVDGKGPDKKEPPNNWLSAFGGSAWEYDSARGQFYFHQFLPEQPDLNYRNPAVREEMKDVLKFWLDLGVDGFRVDALKHLVEVADLRDEPRSNDSTAVDPTDYNYLDHIYTTNQPELFDVNREWRLVLDSYEEKDGEHRLLMAEVYDPLPETMMYYGNDSFRLSDFPFNFQLLPLDENVTASTLYSLVTSYLAAVPEGRWPNWVLGNHDNHRIANRTHVELVDGFNMLTLLLGGTPVTYYGEEIGMHDVYIPFNETQDPYGKKFGPVDYVKYTRDFERTPMQWTNDTHAGFTTADRPWLRVADDFQTNNVEMQRADPNSHLNVYKKLVSLRNEPAITYGDRCFVFENSDNVFAFARVKKGSPGYAVLVNIGGNSTVVDLKNAEGCKSLFQFPDDGIVEVKSSNVSPDSPLYDNKGGAKLKIPLNSIPLGSREAVVVKFVPVFKS